MNSVLIETDDAAPLNTSGRQNAKSIERIRLRID
jgi:hypothetical protein